MTAVLSAVALGCDPVLNDHYAGEPLLTIRGHVLLTADAAPDGELCAALVWSSLSPYGLSMRADDVAIETAFPAEFAVSVSRIPTEEEFPGAWDDLGPLPVAPEVRTLFGVLVAYADDEDNDRPDFDYLGLELLDWLAAPETFDGEMLVGPDQLLGVANDCLVAAVDLPHPQATLGDAVPTGDPPELGSIAGLRDGLLLYRWDSNAGWVTAEDGDEVTLVIEGR